MHSNNVSPYFEKFQAFFLNVVFFFGTNATK